MARLDEGLKEFGIKLDERCEATQKAGRWFRRVEDERRPSYRCFLMRRGAEWQCNMRWLRIRGTEH